MLGLVLALLLAIAQPVAVAAEIETAVLAGAASGAWSTILSICPVWWRPPAASGGHVDQPTYRQVSSETTGHQEVVEVRRIRPRSATAPCCAVTGATWIRWMEAVSSAIAAIPIGR